MTFNPDNTTGQWCDECGGYTHIPFCSRYIDPNTARNILAAIDWQGEVERAVDATNQEIIANGGYLSPQTLKEIAADEELLRRSFYVNAATIRMALADVIDFGDDQHPRHHWIFRADAFVEREHDQENERRVRFIDAVITRVQQLVDRGLVSAY